MIEISDCTNLRVSTSVDEYDISDVAKGQKVVILMDATGDETSSSTKTGNSGTGLDSLMQGAGGNKPNRGYNKSGGAPGGAPGM